MRTTKAQQRSLVALEFVKSVVPATRERFAKLTAGLPAMILQNGLGQTLAFLAAKKKEEHTLAFFAVVGWLERDAIIKHKEPAAAIQALSKLEQRDYLRAQTESLKYLEWLKRYANSDLFRQQQ